MIFEALHDATKRGELLLLDGGFCHWHLRRDGQLTILEIISIRPGAGSELLARLKATPGATSLFAKCPADLEANAWYARRGFVQEGEETTRTGRKLNLWRLQLGLDASTAGNCPAAPSTIPGRIQCTRKRGWRKPAGAVYVGRRSAWGNPFRVGERFQNLSLYIVLMGVQTDEQIAAWYAQGGLEIPDAQTAVDWFRKYAEWRLSVEPTWLDPLRGHDLACWCPLVDKDGNPVPCHADVLLELVGHTCPHCDNADRKGTTATEHAPKS